MPEFSVLDDGFLSEVTTRDASRRAAEVWPGLDEFQLQANMLLVRAYRALTNAGEASLAAHGLTPSRASVIASLFNSSPSPITIGQLATQKQVTSTNISKLIDGLERDGWLARESNPADGRSAHIVLTPEGHRRAREALPASYSAISDHWSGLTRRETRMMIHLLAKLQMHALTRSALDDGLTPEEHGLVPVMEAG